MVVGIGVYSFELNIDDSGEVKPEFRQLSYEPSEEFKDINVKDVLKSDDLFKIFYDQTTVTAQNKEETEGKKDGETPQKKPLLGKIKGAPYKVISNFHQQSLDNAQYLTIAIFHLDDDVDLFEEIMGILAQRIPKVYLRIAQENIKNAQVWESVETDMLMELKYAVFQIERLANLTKVQKVGLIYRSPEKRKTLSFLRKGPISRRKLFYELAKDTDDLNL